MTTKGDVVIWCATALAVVLVVGGITLALYRGVQNGGERKEEQMRVCVEAGGSWVAMDQCLMLERHYG